MKRSNRLVILVGVLLAVLAFVAIVILLNQRDEEVPEEEVRETVLVTTQAIELGDPITPEVVEELLVDPEAVQGTPLRSTSAVAGQAALVPIPNGSQVTAEMIGLGDRTLVDISAQLNPGEKAISFQVDRVTGLDFLVTAGDDIDIILSQQISVLQETADSAANPDENAPPRFEAVTGLENQRTVKAVLQDKRVLYVSATRATAPEPVDTNGDGVVRVRGAKVGGSVPVGHESAGDRRRPRGLDRPADDDDQVAVPGFRSHEPVRRIADLAVDLGEPGSVGDRHRRGRGAVPRSAPPMQRRYTHIGRMTAYDVGVVWGLRCGACVAQAVTRRSVESTVSAPGKRRVSGG